MLQEAYGERVIKHLRYMTGMNVSMIDMIALTTLRIEVVHQIEMLNRCQLCGKDCEKVTEGYL